MSNKPDMEKIIKVLISLLEGEGGEDVARRNQRRAPV